MEENQPLFEEGRIYDLGTIVLSEEEIMEFARNLDPLDFHLSHEAAAKSIFKKLVASGSHIFHVFYKERWLPLFKHTVLAGLGVHDWKFLLPVYPAMPVKATASVFHLKRTEEQNRGIVTWKIEFKNEQDQMLQDMKMVVLHQLNMPYISIKNK